ncbi:MAG: ACT domain-containing protein [Formosimonas sp.]
MTAISNLRTLLRSMQPTLNDGVYAYCHVAHDFNLSSIDFIGAFREAEGLTLIVREAEALAAHWPILFRAAWLSLTVHSDLQAVGLTAAFASALGAAGISCNVVAGALHDHIFVPFEQAQAAMAALHQLQKDNS